MSFITAIGTANPPYQVDQKSIAQFMIRAMELDDNESRKVKVLFDKSGIEARYSVIKDYADPGSFDFFGEPEHKSIPTTKRRNALFKAFALPLSLQAIKNALGDSFDFTTITHLIVVSCTGMYAPGLDIELTHSLGMVPHVQRTCIHFMGCYAAINALRLARSICDGDGKAKVLTVCTELCSLHFQKDPTEDNLIANALFGDGSAAVLITPQHEGQLGLECKNFYGQIFPEGINEMSWDIGDLGFEMKLSGEVPRVIRNGLQSFTARALDGMSIEAVKYLAFHPGGRRILEVLAADLSIRHGADRFAWEVLRHYGNMSSPTILFILERIFRQLQMVDHGETILSYAFGPGLTMESALFTIYHP